MADQTGLERCRPHYWHGLAPGSTPPHLVQACIEITRFDAVKYDIDKVTGYLRVDHPPRSSSQLPALYGFVPRAHCGPLMAALSSDAEQAGGDPLHIFVLSERPVNRSEILVDAVVLGGLRAISDYNAPYGRADGKAA